MDYRDELFKKLGKEFDVTFIFTKQGRGQDNVKEEQEKVPLEWKYHILKSDFIVGGKDIGMYLALTKELLFEEYDIIITSTSLYICWMISKLRGKKFILVTEFWCWKSFSLSRKILNLFIKMIANNSDAILALGTKAYNAHINLGVKIDKMFVYPQCAVDYTSLPIRDLKKEFDLNDKKIILYVGRIVKSKGLDYLIKAFSLLTKYDKNTFLLVVGDGPFKDECENLVKHLGNSNVLFVGHIEGKEKASYYYACDILVTPSIFHHISYEPWGLVVNEAMAFGKPIIATTAVGAAYDLVENGRNGYIVEEKNIEEMCRAMKKILIDDNVKNSMGKESRKIFEDKNDYTKFFCKLKNTIESTSIKK